MHSFLRAYDHEDHRSRSDYRSQTPQVSNFADCQTQNQEGHSCRHEKCQRVVINVSGELFETQLKTLDRYPDTLLGNEAKRLTFWDASRCQYFFDRHRPSFSAILNFYQTGGRLRRPQEVPEEIFYDELKFFEFDRAVIRDFLLSEGYAIRTVSRLSRRTWRARLYAMFEYPDSSCSARIFSVVSVLVIVLSIGLFCIETVPFKSTAKCPLRMKFSYQQQSYRLTNATPALPTLGQWGARARLLSWIFILEAMCVTWFSIEFLIRVISYPYPRKKLLLSPTIWLDIASILPFIVSVIFVQSSVDCIEKQCPRHSYLLKGFGFLRVFRVFKFHKYVTGMQILGRTLRMSFREMTMFVFFMCICIVLFSTAIYLAETGNDRLQFSSIPDSFWWAVISMCTVGYGDYVPRSVYGKLVGGICVVAGVMTIALPVPVIVTNFNTVYRQTVQRRVRPEVVHEKLIPI